jgi:hypothetical protein
MDACNYQQGYFQSDSEHGTHWPSPILYIDKKWLRLQVNHWLLVALSNQD